MSVVAAVSASGMGLASVREVRVRRARERVVRNAGMKSVAGVVPVE